MFSSVTLLVVTLQVFHLTRGIEVWEGESATLPCLAVKNLTDIQWCKEIGEECQTVASKSANVPVRKNNTETEHEFHSLPNASLVISAVNYSKHNATYRCLSNDNSLVPMLVLQPVESVTLSTTSSLVSANTLLKLTCDVNGGNPAPSISWYLGDSRTPVKTELGRQGTMGTYTYQVRVTKEMNGQRVVCEASVRDRSLSDETRINVTFKPFITMGNLPEQYTFGDDVTLKCSVEGNPRPNVTWVFMGNIGYSGDRENNTTLQSENGAITVNYRIGNLNEKQTGEYTCSAKNAEGEYSGTVQVNPKAEKPKSRLLSFIPWCLLGVVLAVAIGVFVYRSSAKKDTPQVDLVEEVPQDPPPCQPVNRELQGHYATVRFVARPPQQVTPQVAGISTSQDDRTIYASVDFKATAKMAKSNKKRNS